MMKLYKAKWEGDGASEGRKEKGILIIKNLL
jgi:hypothetical protein